MSKQLFQIGDLVLDITLTHSHEIGKVVSADYGRGDWYYLVQWGEDETNCSTMRQGEILHK